MISRIRAQKVRNVDIVIDTLDTIVMTYYMELCLINHILPLSSVIILNQLVRLSIK